MSRVQIMATKENAVTLLALLLEAGEETGAIDVKSVARGEVGATIDLEGYQGDLLAFCLGNVGLITDWHIGSEVW